MINFYNGVLGHYVQTNLKINKTYGAWGGGNILRNKLVKLVNYERKKLAYYRLYGHKLSNFARLAKRHPTTNACLCLP